MDILFALLAWWAGSMIDSGGGIATSSYSYHPQPTPLNPNPPGTENPFYRGGKTPDTPGPHYY